MIQNGGGRHLEFIRIENSAIGSAVPKNPTLEPNMEWIGSDDRLRRYGHLDEIFEMRGQSSVAGRSVVNIYLLSLISYTPLRYVRNVAREE